MAYRSTILTTLLIMGLFSLFGCGKKPDLDGLVLTQLKKAGSDLSKPHHIEFFVYFPTEAAAQQAAAKIEAMGFGDDVKQAAQGSDWLCHTTRTMVPDLPALQKIRVEFSDLATSLGGKYDGWGTQIEK